MGKKGRHNIKKLKKGKVTPAVDRALENNKKGGERK